MKRFSVGWPLFVLAVLLFAACQPIPPGGAGTPTPMSEATATMAAETPTEAITGTEEMTGTGGMSGTEAITGTEGMSGTEAMTGTEGMSGTEAMTGTSGGAMPENTVQVSLNEYTIDMATALSAGMTTFQVTNDGTEEHSFVIEGQGIDQELANTLQPGETGTLQVDLSAGDYEAYCPVDDHEGQGMRVTLTVQ